MRLSFYARFPLRHLGKVFLRGEQKESDGISDGTFRAKEEVLSVISNC
ncbi:MAG: hypothetical protein KAS71_07015 [Bacteroidales bacterium]|nr:hypothetical protein [Bacteroidales bacterium]